EPDGVPGHPDGIELEVDRAREVLERVVEPGLPSVAEFGVDAEQDGRDEHDDEQAVPGPDSGGQRAEAASATPAWLAPPDRPGSPRRRPARRGRRHYSQAVPSCAGSMTPIVNKRPVLVRSSPAYGNTRPPLSGATSAALSSLSDPAARQ